jgi:hypothetical protein
VALVASILVSDVLLFYGGYNGMLKVKWNVGLIELMLLFALFVALCLEASKRLRNRGYATGFASAVGFVLLIVYYVAAHGPGDPYFTGARLRVRRTVNPEELRRWANRVMQQAPAGEETFIPPTNLPAFLKIPGWPLSGGLVSKDSGFVRVAWGTSMAGTYGLEVYLDRSLAGPGDVLWQDGIYFFSR